MSTEGKKPLPPGWRQGTVAEFLGLTPEEEAEVERRAALPQDSEEFKRLMGECETDETGEDA